jgi:MoaA/NifB/PqqE/SkfB family radical SAM enzyme
MRKVGVKSIMFGGEGEPLLHPKFTEIVKYAKSIGFDISLTTNGVLLNRKKIEEILPNLTWIKFSVDAGDEDTYKYLHGSKDGDLKRILDNISISSFIKKLKKYNLNIGVQAILFKNNVESILLLARSLKYLHPDYFVIKPYSEHSSSKNNKLQPPTEEQKKQFINDMKIYNEDYEFIYRDIAFENIEKKRPYNKCYGRDFMAYIDTTGNVYSCINFLGNKDFIYGNIYNDSFENIWKNKQEINPDLDKCRIICRLDNINRYLWKLKYPEKDVNFI